MAPAQRRSRNKDSGAKSFSVEAREIGKFTALAEQWWDPHGAFGALHRLNPLRLEFIRDESIAEFHRDARALAPFAGLTLLDIGCGGGLLSEPLARQGFLGIDVGDESIAVAAAHAKDSGVSARYRNATVERIAAEGAAFDVVLAMEVIEHVADRDAFLKAATAVLKPGGLMVLASINRTLRSLMLAKIGAEYVLGWIPRGTHDWNKFVSPRAVTNTLEDLGLTVLKASGVSFDPLAWQWRLSGDTSVNYILAARK